MYVCALCSMYVYLHVSFVEYFIDALLGFRMFFHFHIHLSVQYKDHVYFALSLNVAHYTPAAFFAIANFRRNSIIIKTLKFC